MEAGQPRPMSAINKPIGMGGAELLSELPGHDDVGEGIETRRHPATTKEPSTSMRIENRQAPSQSGSETGEPGQARNDPGRHESEEERQDRNLSELLQELRVAGIGVQVLFGFLLSLPFSMRFTHLGAAQRRLYIVSLVLAALATGLLTAPVAYHRLVFRQHKKARLLRVANGMALAGLAVVGLAISSAVLLVTGVVLKGAVVPLVSSSVAAMFAILWFVVPLLSGRIDGRADR